jgi:RimJ/RimL family protein N-acetyltransferase
MNAQLNHIAAQEHDADLSRRAEQKRIARMAARNASPQRTAPAHRPQVPPPRAAGRPLLVLMPGATDTFDRASVTPAVAANDVTIYVFAADEAIQRLSELDSARCPSGPLLVSSSQAIDVLVLPVGTRLTLRQIGSDDRDGLAALFARLTPESRRRRFLSAKPELTRRELAYLTDIDHVHHEAIAAVDQRDGSIVGVGRYVHHGDRARVAEVAVEVVDELQRMGIGTVLARRTVQRARENGFTLLTAATLWENRPARALLRQLGFRARASHGTEIEHELPL